MSEECKCNPEDISYHEVVMRFKLPYAKEEMEEALKGAEYSSALWDIYQKCRTVWKYEENASEDRVKLAEEIGEIISETGVMER